MFSVIFENFSWMTINILLAFIPVLLGWLFYEAKNQIMKIVIFAGWLFFVPNTIYIFTDILHFMQQINEINLFGAAVLAAQYEILFITGFLTYILSMYPVEKKLKLSTSVIIGINFIIGFGIVIGRIHRLNSWDIIIQTGSVINAALGTITSFELFSLAILFGLFANFMYFLFREKFDKICRMRLN